MVNIDFELDLSDPDVLDFLVDGTVDTLTRPALQPEGFTERARRNNDVDKATTAARYLQRERYAVVLAPPQQPPPSPPPGPAAQQGTVTCEVFCEQQITIQVNYVLYLKDGLPADVVQRAIELVAQYDQATHGDLAAWISEQIKDGWIAEADLRVAGEMVIEKQGTPRDLNASQRDALFKLYGIGGGHWQSRVHILYNDDGSFSQWATRRRAKLEPVAIEPVYQSPPAPVREIAEVQAKNPPGSAADAQVGTLLDKALRDIVPVQCRGSMQREQVKLISVFAWPEFKLEWRSVRIKVGCARITIVVPVIRIRIAHLVLYMYYHFPRQVDQAVLTIVKNCAIRAALAGAVIGIVVGNPAAAITAFQSYLMSCVQQDAYECLNPGIFLVKEVTAWT